MSNSSVLKKMKYIFFAIPASVALACPHVPPDYKFSVKETTKEALIYHDGVNAHLILKTGFESTGEFPSSMAWVIPLPSLPSSYKEENGGLFEQLFIWFANWPVMKGEGSFPLGAETSPDNAGIEIHKTIMTGSYKITPVEIKSKSAGSELNGWLASNGYGTVDAKLQKFYLHKGATFLAVRIEGQKGQAVDLKPIHIVYKASKISLPLKFSSGSGVFDVILYTFTEKSIEENALEKYHLSAKPSRDIEELRNADGTNPLFKIIGNQKGFLTQYTGTAFNAMGQMVNDLPDDPSIAVDKATKK